MRVSFASLSLSFFFSFFFLMIPRPPGSTLSPYTTLFRSTKDMYLAGDDDQAIYAWAGADVDRFIKEPATEVVDRKSTRLNSSHGYISYAVFCLKKKKTSKHEAYKRGVEDMSEGGRFAIERLLHKSSSDSETVERE